MGGVSPWPVLGVSGEGCERWRVSPWPVLGVSGEGCGPHPGLCWGCRERAVNGGGGLILACAGGVGRGL